MFIRECLIILWDYYSIFIQLFTARTSYVVTAKAKAKAKGKAKSKSKLRAGVRQLFFALLVCKALKASRGSKK